MLTYHQWGSVASIWEQFYKRCLSHRSLNLAWKLLLKFCSSLPGTNELIHKCLHGTQFCSIAVCCYVPGSENLIISVIDKKKKTTSLPTGRCSNNYKSIVLYLIMHNSSLCIRCEIAFMWMQQKFMNEKSTLVQIMVWYHQVTSHYPSQCWPRSMSPYGGIGLQRVKVKKGLFKNIIHT